MKKLRIVLLLSIVFSVLGILLPLKTHAETKIVILGHLYPVMENKELVERLVKKIASQSPDYVAILGDSNLDDAKVVKFWKEKFGNRMLFAPGNNEVVDGKLSAYEKNIGYLFKSFQTDDCRIIILNSLAHRTEIKQFLNSIPNKNSRKKSIMLTHHRIWDDTLTSAEPLQHDKSYYFADIFDLVKNTTDIIFAGNSKRQYFYDFTKTYGSQNVNNIFWTDAVGDVVGYSIGTGDGYPKLGFVRVRCGRNFTEVKPLHILNSLEDPIPISALTIHKNSIAPIDKSTTPRDQLLNEDAKSILVFSVYEKMALFYLTGVLSALFIFWLAKYIRKKWAWK